MIDTVSLSIARFVNMDMRLWHEFLISEAKKVTEIELNKEN